MVNLTPEERARIRNFLGVESREATLNPAGTNLAFGDADSGFADGKPIRLQGFDAPETQHNGLDAEPLAYDARDELARQVVRSGGATVDSGQQDAYGRELVTLTGNDGRNLNETMIRSGMVNRPMFEPNQAARENFHVANWRTSTELGNILQGDTREVNQRVRALQQEAMAKRDRGELAPLVHPSTYEPGSIWNRAWTRGVHNMAATFNGFAAALGDATGSEDIKAWGEQGMAERIRKAAAFPAEVQDWDDVQSLDKFGTFALERIGETLPQLGVDAVAFLGTGGTATAARIGFAKALARELPPDALAKFATRAGQAGALGSMYAQGTGETALNLNAAGVDEYGNTALITGVGKAALDYAPLAYSLRTAKAMSKLSGGELGRVAGKLAASAGVEGTTEGAQTVLDFIAEKYHTGADIFSEENLKELRTAIAAGAIVGGATTAPGAIPPAYRAVRDRYFSGLQQKTPADQPAVAEQPGVDDPDFDAFAEGFTETTREPAADIAAQSKAMADGQKQGMFVSRANADSFDQLRSEHPDAQAIETEEGLLLSNNPVDEADYRSGDNTKRDIIRATVLGITDPKQAVDAETAVVVQTLDPAGAVVQEEATNDPDSVVRKQEDRATPEQTVVVKPLTDAMIERQQRVEDERHSTDSPRTDVLSDRQPELPNEGPATPDTRTVDGMVPTEIPAMGPAEGNSAVEGAVPSAAIRADAEGEPTALSTGGVPGTDTTGVAATAPGEESGGRTDASVSSDGDIPNGAAGVEQGAPDAGSTEQRVGRNLADTPRRRVDPTDLARIVARLRDPQDGLAELVRAYAAQGADPQAALEYALGYEAAPEPTTEPTTEVDSFEEQLNTWLSEDTDAAPSEEADLQSMFDTWLSTDTETPQVDDTSTPVAEDPWAETADVEPEDFVNDYQLTGEIHERDIGSFPGPNPAAGRPVYGDLLRLYKNAFEADNPTYTLAMRQVASRKRGEPAFSLFPELKTFTQPEDAAVEVSRLEKLYPDSSFEVIRGEKGYNLLRHKLIGALQGNLEDTTTWANRHMPNLLLNARGMYKTINELTRQMDSAIGTEYAELAAQLADRSREIVRLYDKKGREVHLHAPSITAAGRRSVQDLTGLTNLERQFAAFNSGLASLYDSGYTLVDSDPSALAQIKFVNTVDNATVADVLATRNAAKQLGHEDIPYYVSTIAQLYKERAEVMQSEPVRMGIPAAQVRFNIDRQIRLNKRLLARAKRDYERATARDVDEPETSLITMEHSRADVFESGDPYYFTYAARHTQEHSALTGTMVPTVVQDITGVRSELRDALIAKRNNPFSQRRDKVSGGLSMDQAQAVTLQFLREFPGANDVQVSYSMFAPAGHEQDAALYYPTENRMEIFVSNIPSADELKRTLRHELFVHKGLGFLTDAEAQQYFAELQSAINSDPQLAQAFTEVQRLYASESPAVQLEETLAFIAETIDTGWASRTINRIMSVIRRVLRAMRLIPDTATRDDIELVLQDIASAFAQGKRAPIRQAAHIPPAMARVKWDAARVQEGTQKLASGLKKLVMPMTNGLYQLQEISPRAAFLFRRYWQARDRSRAFWEGEFQNRVNMSAEQVNNAWRELNSYGEVDSLPATASADARKLREFLDAFYEQYAKTTMPTLGKIRNYLPQLVDVNQLRTRKEEFLDLLTGRKVAWQDTPLTRDQAQGIYSRLMDNGGTYEHALEDYTGVVPPGNEHRKQRSLRDPALIGAMEDAGFLYGDKREAIDHYLTVSVNRGAFESIFGGYRTLTNMRHRNTGKLNRTRLLELFQQAGRDDIVRGADKKSSAALMQEAVRSGYMKYSPAEKGNPERFSWYAPTEQLSMLRNSVRDAQQRARMDEITHGFMGYFGARVSPEVHNIQSNVLAYQSVLTLAFSTLSSLPDFAGPFLRVMQDQGVMSALGSLRGAMRTAMSDYPKAKEFARQFGFLNHRQNQAALKAMWGQEHASPTAQKILDNLFKYNGQEWLTKQSRTLAAEVGRDYFQTLAASHDPALEQYGLTAEQVDTWQDAGSPAFTVALKEAGGKVAEATEAMHNALHQFVDQSVIRPNAGQRPVWANDPRFAVFWHLKSFLWAYWSVIISPTGQSIVRQAKQGEYGEAAAQMAFMALMVLPAAALGWEVRQLLQYTLWGEEQPSDSMDGFAYTGELLQRSGLGGPFQLLFDVGSQEDATSGLLRISGPTMDHLFTLLNGDWDEKVYRSIPLLSQTYGLQKTISGIF